MYSPSETAQIQVFRQKVNNGTITKDELREALAILQRGRGQAHDASAASRTRKASTTAKKNINSDDLLGELDGM